MLKLKPPIVKKGSNVNKKEILNNAELNAARRKKLGTSG